MKTTFVMSDRVLCPNCGREHLSSERNCTYCGHDLADLIVDFKDKHLPISFNNEEKKEIKQKEQTQGSIKVRKIPSKKIRNGVNIFAFLIILAIVISSILYGVYPDIYSEDSAEAFVNFALLLTLFMFLFLIILYPLIRINTLIASEGRSGGCKKGPVFTKKEFEQKPMKVKKIPSGKIMDSLLVFSILLIFGGIAVVAVLSLSGSGDINYIGFIIFFLGFVLIIPWMILRSLIASKGRSYCCSNLYPTSDYEPSKAEECLQSLEGCNCGIGFMIFFIDLISILFKK